MNFRIKYEMNWSGIKHKVARTVKVLKVFYDHVNPNQLIKLECDASWSAASERSTQSVLESNKIQFKGKKPAQQAVANVV